MSRFLTTGVPGGFNPRRIGGCKLWLAGYRSTFYKYDGTFNGSVSGAADNGVGLIRITTLAAHGLATSDQVVIASVGGTTEANGTWTITVITATTFDLQGSTFANAYTTGGTWNANGMLANVDGTVIGKMTDLSGQGNDRTQSVAGKKPLYKTNIQNSLPVVRLDGVNDELEGSSQLGSAYFSASAATIFAVLKGPGAADTAGFIGWESAVGNRVMVFSWSDPNIYFDFGDIAAGGRISAGKPAGWADNWHVVVARRNAGDGLVRVDGVDVVTGTFTDSLDTTASAILYVGSIGITGFFTKDIAEVAVYSTAISDANRRKLERYGSRRYGITVS